MQDNNKKYARIQEWVKDAQAGNGSAREHLIENFMPLVLKLASQYAHKDSFEDARQDGILALIEAIYSYDCASDCPFPAYARMYLVFYYKKRQEGRFDKSVQAATSLDAIVGEGGTTLAELIADPNDFIKAYEEEEAFGQLLIALKKALSTLPENQKRAITAYYYEGKSQKAIAKTEKVTEATIKMRIFRGIQKVRKILD